MLYLSVEDSTGSLLSRSEHADESSGLVTTLIQQFMLGGLALLLLTATFMLMRRERLSFTGGLLWLGVGAFTAAGSLALPNIDALGNLLGALPAGIFAAIVTVLLGSIAFLLSLRVSALEESVRDTGEAVARNSVDLAEMRVAATASTVLVVVPALNEERSVGDVVTGMVRMGLRVLVVDDGSTDQTAEAARAAGADVLRLPTNLGVGGALRAAFRVAREAGFHQVIQCDGDGQHPPEAVQRLLDEAHDEVDLLIGSRFTGGFQDVRGTARRTAIRTLSAIASGAVGTRVTDSTSGLRLIREPLLGEVARSMPRHYLGDTFELVIAAGRAGYRISEIPVTMLPRKHGTSSASPISAVGLTLRAILVTLLRVQRPYADRGDHVAYGKKAVDGR